jgi:hypothetical protein
MNSAAAVLRMQYEGLLRAAWLLFAANPAYVEKLAMPLSLAAEKGAKNLPGNLDMLAELSLRKSRHLACSPRWPSSTSSPDTH